MKKIFYISAWSQESHDGGIYTYELQKNGTLEQLGFSHIAMAGYICFSPDGKNLYVTCSDSNGNEGIAGYVLNEDGVPEFLNFVACEGKSCCHNCVSQDGLFIYAANYSSGTFSVFKRNEDGSVGQHIANIKHEGSGPVADRQESAHPHYVQMTPDGSFVVVADLGIDKLMVYPYNSEKGVDAEKVKEFVMPAGCGPRHLVFDKFSGIAYLVTELGNTVISMRYEDGEFQTIQELPILSGKCNVYSKASAIRMSGDGGFLVATNRGWDTLVTIALDGKGGMKLRNIQLSGGNSPRDVNFLPGMNHFAGANEFSDNVYFFNFDPEKGTLIPNGVKLELPRPLCIAWQ